VSWRTTEYATETRDANIGPRIQFLSVVCGIEREDIRISWVDQLREHRINRSFTNEECIFFSNVAPTVVFPRLRHPSLVPFGTISSMQYSRNQQISHLVLRAIIAHKWRCANALAICDKTSQTAPNIKRIYSIILSVSGLHILWVFFIRIIINAKVSPFFYQKKYIAFLKPRLENLILKHNVSIFTSFYNDNKYRYLSARNRLVYWSVFLRGKNVILIIKLSKLNGWLRFSSL